MEINEKEFRMWLETLRSGKYKQTKGKLQRVYRYCCLGVACKILIPEDKLDKFYDEMSGNTPHGQYYAPQWLKDINTDFYHKTNLSIVDMNDNLNYSFERIADELEYVYYPNLQVRMRIFMWRIKDFFNKFKKNNKLMKLKH